MSDIENGLYYVGKCKKLLDEAELLGNTIGEQINLVKNGYLDDITREFNRLQTKIDTLEGKR